MSAPDLRRQVGPHVFVADLGAPELDDADAHHLARVLRVRPGDAFTISDARGRWCTAAFGPQPDVTGPVVEEPAPRWPVTVAAALTKGSKPETVVQKVTELGADRIIFFRGDRSIPRWDDAKRDKALDRFARIAREAAMQSRRVRLPAIDWCDDLGAVVAQTGETALARADFSGAGPAAPVRAIAVGPEGGWSADEVERVPHVVDLGPTVLRAETAAIVAAARLAEARNVA